MTRQAILIGAPNVTPHLPGVVQDLKDIKSFLLSNSGGAWREDEIVTLTDPSLKSVETYIQAAQLKDYVFITCSGHGEHQIGKEIDQTFMHLNKNETISISKINPKNKRHLVVVDVCRGIVKVEERFKTFIESSMFNRTYDSFVDYRKVFDHAVMQCTEGRIVVYSCDINQSAGEDRKGGIFTQQLLNTSKNFKRNGGSYAIVDINQAFEVAKKETYDKNAPQSAVMYAGRRRDFFPFSIV